ncbi:MAG: GWxTD domain-containing protein [Saprospiraceae bacterium]|nr:GWxTD domain-containing protein [Saprospiraceae bacterium]
MKRIFSIFILILIIFSCRTYTKISNQNLAYLYNVEENSLNPEYSAFHVSDSLTIIYVKVWLPELLYIKTIDTDSFIANFKIKAELYNSYESKVIIDSTSVLMSEFENYNKKLYFISSLNIKAKFPGKYLLKLDFTDINKNKSFLSYLNIDKSNHNSRDNFKLLNINEKVVFGNIVKPDVKYKLNYRNKNTNNLYVRYYNRNFNIAYPPYSMERNALFEYKADSTFTIKLKMGQSDFLSLHKKGFYHFQEDTTQKEGFTLFVFNANFPQVNTASQMLPPLRYLVTKNEYKKMLESDNIKREIDKFWIENSGNPDRARVMIKKYYNRVQNANELFTSYHEGWKTDRGMIYIVYGEPNVVYRGSNHETWIYGEVGNMLSVTFRFLKVKNPFTDNDYSLTDKSPIYKDSWYNAIDTWRR